MGEEFYTGKLGEIVEVRQSKCVQCSTAKFEREALDFTQNELLSLLSSQEYQLHKQRNQQRNQQQLHGSPDISTDKINAKEVYVKVWLLEVLIHSLISITLAILGFPDISYFVSAVILFVSAITRTGHLSAIILPLVLVDHSQQLIETGEVVIRWCALVSIMNTICFLVMYTDGLLELTLSQYPKLIINIASCLSFAITDYLLGYRFAFRKTSLWEIVERSKWYYDLVLFITCYFVANYWIVYIDWFFNMSGDE